MDNILHCSKNVGQCSKKSIPLNNFLNINAQNIYNYDKENFNNYSHWYADDAVILR